MKVTTNLLSEEFWNAVADKKVVSAGENLERVETAAEKKTGRRDFPLLFIERGAHVYKD